MRRTLILLVVLALLSMSAMSVFALREGTHPHNDRGNFPALCDSSVELFRHVSPDGQASFSIYNHNTGTYSEFISTSDLYPTPTETTVLNYTDHAQAVYWPGSTGKNGTIAVTLLADNGKSCFGEIFQTGNYYWFWMESFDPNE